MQRVRFKSRIPVPAEHLFAWHARAGAFERLAPPWQRIEVVAREGSIRNGDVLKMKLLVGPAGKSWVALHDQFVDGEQFRDTQVLGPFDVWEHTHRIHRDGPESSILEDDVSFQIPFERLVDPVVGSFARHEVRRMFRYRHQRTRLDVMRHVTFRDMPRVQVAVLGTHPFAAQISAFLTGGGHSIVPVSVADVVTDLRPLDGRQTLVMDMKDTAFVVAVEPEPVYYGEHGAGPKTATITLASEVIGPSFGYAGPIKLLKSRLRAPVRDNTSWVAEDDVLGLVHHLLMTSRRAAAIASWDPSTYPQGFVRAFTESASALGFISGRP